MTMSFKNNIDTGNCQKQPDVSYVFKPDLASSAR